MIQIENAFQLAFKKAVLEHTEKKKKAINTAINKKQSNKITMSGKIDESKKIISDERIGKSHNPHGVG